MKPVSIALVSNNPNIAAMQTEMLRAASFRKVTRIDDLGVLKSAIRYHTFDLVVVNDLGSVDVERAAQIIRDEVNNKDPFTMSLLVTAKTTRSKVRTAICLGYDDLLTMPFSSDTFITKLAHLAKIDRRFIRVGGYFGPDRRRLDEGPPSGTGERRKDHGFRGQMIEKSALDSTRKLMGAVSDEQLFGTDSN